MVKLHVTNTKNVTLIYNIIQNDTIDVIQNL
jgi:hypothetical protein